MMPEIPAIRVSSASARVGASMRSMVLRVYLWMARSLFRSDGSKKVIARPLLPALAVRPIRWMPYSRPIPVPVCA
ncbi:MAG: hypothetical protein ACXQTG_01820 [Methanoculleaceae archaeon]